MLGRLEMQIDACIEAFIKISELVFQKPQIEATRAKFDAKELERAVQDLLVAQGQDVNALLWSEENTRCKV
jgi:hypothetical protein